MSNFPKSILSKLSLRKKPGGEPTGPQDPSGKKPLSQENDGKLSLQLWDGAYTALKEADATKSLVIEYEGILTGKKKNGKLASATTQTNMLDSCSGQERLGMMKQITETSLEKAKHQKTEAAADVVLKLIEVAQAQVGGLLQAYPPAAIAWSGFCTLTPFLLKPIKENQNMREGLDHIITRMAFSMKLTCLLLKDNWNHDSDFKRARAEIQTKVQSLYQKILEYEMRCVKACHNRWIPLRNAVGWERWADQLKLIRDSEIELEKDMKAYNSEAVKEYLRTSNTHLEELVEQAKKAAERALTTDHDKLVGPFNVVENKNKDPVKLMESHIENTCGWFFLHKNYKEWLRSEGVGLLIVSAPPGCGKTVLAAYLVEQELPDQWSDGQICYYFFDNQGEQKTITNAIRAMIHQLLSKNTEIVGVIESDVRKAGENLQKNVSQLGNVFKKAAESGFAGRVICVVDGLDECGRGELAWFVDWLGQFKPSEGVPSIKFLVTTQGLPDILKMFKPFGKAYRHISAEDESLSEMLQKEIEVVMKKRFDEFAGKVILESDPESGSKKQASLWKSMEEASHGQRTYLWLKLVFDALYLSTKKTQKDWEAVVKSPPLTIVGAYDKLFKFVEDEDKDEVKVLLSLIYASSATRPLTISEANIATTIHRMRLSQQASIASEDQLVEYEMEPAAAFRERVIQKCGFFVSISDDRLYFIHQSARDYLSLSREKLEKARELESNNPNTTANNVIHSFGGCLSDRSAHATITECCVAYLAIDNVMAIDDYDFVDSIDSSHPPDLSNLRFLEYSMQNWIAHFLIAQEFHFEGAKPTVVDIDDRFSDRYFALWDNILRRGKYVLLMPVMHRSTNKYRSPRGPGSVIAWSNDILAVSVACGQAKLLNRLLESAEQKEDLGKIFNKTYGTSIDDFPSSMNLSHVACSEGYIDLTRFILDHGMTLKLWRPHKTVLCRSLIDLAVTQQLPEMVAMLLERGAEIDAKELGFGGTSLGISLLLDIRRRLACSSVLLKHGVSFEQAFSEIPRERSYMLRDIIKTLDMHDFGTHEGFLEAVSAAGYDLEEIRADYQTTSLLG